MFIAATAVTAALSTPASTATLELDRYDVNGIAFTYPDRWFVTTRPLSNGVNPKYRFTLSTVSVRRTARDLGPCLPGIAKLVPKTGVLAYLREALGADRARSISRMQPRPGRFRLPTRADTALCGFGHGGRWIPFREAGRAFYLGLYVGPRAAPSTRRMLERSLRSMEIEPAK
ncbi:MAG: hypothetical protein ACRDPV_09890 [Gaiellaceae bacterium]